MNKFVRYGVGAPLAGIVTLSLTFSMAKMIATEFKAQDKLETYAFAINPMPDDPSTELPRTELEELRKVEVPPAPPELDTGETDPVLGPVITLTGSKPDFDPDVVLVAGPTIVPIDSNPQPILRYAPAMPSRAERSGHCNVQFNVSAEGTPYDIKTTYCTQSLFERSTLRSVAKWKYRPRIQNGQAVAMMGVTNRVVYRLTDEKGNVIPG